jgi:hypothetical protein
MWAAAVLARAGLADSARHVLVRNRVSEQIDPARDLETMEAYVRVVLASPQDRDEALRLIKDIMAANPEHDVTNDKATDWWFRPLQSDPRWAELRRASR